MYRALKDLGHEVDLYAAYLDKRAWQVILTVWAVSQSLSCLGSRQLTGSFVVLRYSGRSGHLVLREAR